MLEFCQEPGVLYVFMMLDIAVYIAKILIPIVLIVVGMIDFFKAILNAEELKKQVPVFIKRIVAALFVFLVPTFVSFVFDALVNFSSTASKFNACFENANLNSINALIAEKEAELEAKRNEQQKDNDDLIVKPPVDNSDLSNSDNNDDESPSQSLTPSGPGYGNLLVGDSRTAGYSYQLTLRDSDEIYATSGGTMSHFKSDVAKAIDHISSDPSHRYNLVLNYGVNNLGDDYVTAYKDVINQVNDRANILIVSVNPCNDNIAKYCKNANIEKFNQAIKNEFSSGYSNVKYCDTYTQFINQPNYTKMIETQEGIHYTTQGAQFIYDRISECLSTF